MLVPNLLSLVQRLVLRIVQILEDVLEPPVVLLQNRVLRAQVERVSPVERELQGGVRKVDYGRVRVEHSQGDAGPLVLVDGVLDCLAVRAGKDQL